MRTSSPLSKEHPSYSIVLVNYKTLGITKICLELLKQHVENKPVTVWVVDNYSADESTEYLRSLDWINLIERPPSQPEAGHIAHGRALDLALEKIHTDYVFLLHTDTFVFDKTVFAMMLDRSLSNPNIAAVGCVEQLDRGLARTAWRFSTRLCKHYFRRTKRYFGLRTKDPKPYKEAHLKSFCTLWNAKLIKLHGLNFQMGNDVPGYALQDRMVEMGYSIDFLSPRKIFKYLDHMQSGTVSAAGGYGANHRRTKMYNDILQRLNTGGYGS